MKKLIAKKIYFVGEKLPMTLKASNELFGVCVRKLHKRHDREILNFEVRRGAYFTFEEAYETLKDEMIYSCLDYKKMLKAPHNLILNPYDFESQESIDELLKDLTEGKVELSQRNEGRLELDYIRTIRNQKQNHDTKNT